MANTITDLIPILYDALDIVSREMVGFVPAVTRNSSAERAAKDEYVRYPVVPAIATEDIAPGAAPAASTGGIVDPALRRDRRPRRPVLSIRGTMNVLIISMPDFRVVARRTMRCVARSKCSLNRCRLRKCRIQPMVKQRQNS